MTNLGQNHIAATAKKGEPMEKSSIKADEIVTEPLQEDSPLLPMVTEASKVKGTDLVVFLKRHHIELSSC